jgi:hypothetical protein
MKTLAIILFITPFWIMNGLAQEKKVEDLLNDEETRSEIFKTILNNHQLMVDFMEAMRDNDHAMMMMQRNPGMMGNSSMGGMKMNNEHQMMQMKNENSEAMNQMMGIMKENPQIIPEIMGRMMDISENDSTLSKHMIEVMSEHPHMMRMGIQNTSNAN